MHVLAVDVMSGDSGPDAVIHAVYNMLAKNNDVKVILVGEKKSFFTLLSENPRVEVENASDVVPMNELPSRAIRRRHSSMRRSVEMVAEGRAHVAVSAGNTGCLLGVSLIVLRGAQGVLRPAFASFMPTGKTDGSCMLDLGANVECSAEMLHQFALMGSALVRSVKGINQPRVGLLNVGEENFKGREELRKASEFLQNDKRVNFIGNIEGNDIYFDVVDVVVCDGFTGNVVLKATEGVARMIRGIIADAFRQGWLSRLCGLVAMPVLSKLQRTMDPRRYNGACLLGLRGLVVKSHGNADVRSFEAALDYAISAVRRNINDVIDEVSLPDTPAADADEISSLPPAKGNIT